MFSIRRMFSGLVLTGAVLAATMAPAAAGTIESDPQPLSAGDTITVVFTPDDGCTFQLRGSPVVDILDETGAVVATGIEAAPGPVAGSFEIAYTTPASANPGNWAYRWSSTETGYFAENCSPVERETASTMQLSGDAGAGNYVINFDSAADLAYTQDCLAQNRILAYAGENGDLSGSLFWALTDDHADLAFVGTTMTVSNFEVDPFGDQRLVEWNASAQSVLETTLAANNPAEIGSGSLICYGFTIFSPKEVFVVVPLIAPIPAAIMAAAAGAGLLGVVAIRRRNTL